MKQKEKKKLVIVWTLILTLFLTTIFYLIPKTIASYHSLMLIDINARVTQLETTYEQLSTESSVKLLETLEVAQEPFKQEVLFSNYGTWDNESLDITASGHTSEDFEINDLGMYTFEGKIVLATANTNRWTKALKSSYNSHELYDSINFELNGNAFEGIVLDVCGACHGLDNEALQRYDIYTTNNVVGLTEGLIFWGEEK